MNTVNESLVQQEQERRRAAEEAARRDTAGTMKWGRILRYLGWACGLVPVIGIAGVAIFLVLSVFFFAYAKTKGNTEGLKQMFFSIGSLFGAFILWLIVNFVVLAMFGVGAGWFH